MVKKEINKMIYRYRVMIVLIIMKMVKPRALDIMFCLKKKKVKFANKNSINKASEVYKINRTMISRWVKRIKSCIKMNYKRKIFKIPTGKETAQLPFLEREVFKWIIEKCVLGACISEFAIQQKAIELYPMLYANVSETMKQFEASNS